MKGLSKANWIEFLHNRLTFNYYFLNLILQLACSKTPASNGGGTVSIVNRKPYKLAGPSATTTVNPGGSRRCSPTPPTNNITNNGIKMPQRTGGDKNELSSVGTNSG